MKMAIPMFMRRFFINGKTFLLVFSVRILEDFYYSSSWSDFYKVSAQLLDYWPEMVLLS